MDILWDVSEPMTPREVLDTLPPERRVAYTTVMTVMTRLWKKDRLVRERRGRAFAYRPVRSRVEHTSDRMNEILDAASDRSLALTQFAETLSSAERDKLRDLLEDS